MMKKLFFFILIPLYSLFFSQNKTVFDVARSGTVQELIFLMKTDPNIINTTDERSFSALILACYRGNVDVASYLMDFVKDINYQSSEGTALDALCMNYNEDLVKKILAKKANPNIMTKGSNALFWAVKSANLPLLRYLLNNGADKNMKDEMGFTPYEYAMKSQNHEIIKILKSE